MRVLIAAGGTAGHINPALAIAGAYGLGHPWLHWLCKPLATLLVSAMASINSTAISPARTLLAMAHYGAMPQE